MPVNDCDVVVHPFPQARQVALALGAFYPLGGKRFGHDPIDFELHPAADRVVSIMLDRSRIALSRPSASLAVVEAPVTAVPK